MHSYILALPVWVRKCVTLAKKSHPLLQSLIGFTGSWSSQEFSFAPNIFPTCPITGFFILSSFRSKCAKLPFIPISHIQSFLGATTISCFWAKIPYPLPFQPENYCRKKKKKVSAYTRGSISFHSLFAVHQLQSIIQKLQVAPLLQA